MREVVNMLSWVYGKMLELDLDAAEAMLKDDIEFEEEEEEEKECLIWEAVVISLKAKLLYMNKEVYPCMYSSFLSLHFYACTSSVYVCENLFL